MDMRTTQFANVGKLIGLTKLFSENRQKVLSLWPVPASRCKIFVERPCSSTDRIEVS